MTQTMDAVKPQALPQTPDDKMKKVVIAFDVDGTLRCNAEDRHKVEIECNLRIVQLWDTLSTFKNVELHIWSNRGAEYCKLIAERFNLKKCKGYHWKTWSGNRELGDGFVPNIAIDDQQRFDGAAINLIVREK